jgi:hypothetical protein
MIIKEIIFIKWSLFSKGEWAFVFRLTLCDERYAMLHALCAMRDVGK